MSAHPGMIVGSRESPVVRELLAVVAHTPDFKLTANNGLSNSWFDYTGKVKILSVVRAETLSDS